MLIILKPYIIFNISCNKCISGRWTINPTCTMYASFSCAFIGKSQIWCSSFLLCWFLLASHTGKGLTLSQSFPGDSSKAISICHCICSQDSGRQNGNHKTAEVSGALPALQPPHWHPGHRQGHRHSAAGSCLSSPARVAGISPSEA